MSESKKAAAKKILWLDLEMTGLEPGQDKILELAAIITDWDFNELASLETIVWQPKSVLKQMNDWALQHHTASGLLDKIAQGVPDEEAEAALLRLIDAHFAKGEPVLLAGNSIHQDRRFIRADWKKLEARLHYRMLDVSAWKVVMKAKYGLEFDKSETHRALDDIKESIAELKFYLSRV